MEAAGTLSGGGQAASWMWGAHAGTPSRRGWCIHSSSVSSSSSSAQTTGKSHVQPTYRASLLYRARLPADWLVPRGKRAITAFTPFHIIEERMVLSVFLCYGCCQPLTGRNGLSPERSPCCLRLVLGGGWRGT